MSSRMVHLTATQPKPQLTVVKADTPAPQAGEVLVKMRLAPVNPADIFSIMGVYPGFQPASLPATPGLEGMGEVVALGDGVSSLNVGQRVVPLFIHSDKMVQAGNGSWREHVVVPAEYCFPVPDDVTDESAAQLVVNPFTAWAMLHELNAPAGEYIIQSAAGSVLGRQVIQMAKHLGLKSINVVRRREQFAELLALGADHVLCSEDEDIPARVREITGGKLAYGGIDAVGGDLVEKLTGSIRNAGHLLIYGAMSGLSFKGSVIDALFRGVVVRGFWVTPWTAAVGLPRCHEIATELWKLFSNGTVVPFAGDKYPIEEVEAAVAASQAPARGGKVLLKF